MAVDPNLLRKIKLNRRIRHNVLDEDYADHIAACLRDLEICGVHEPPRFDSQEMDPLIVNAIKLYCWAHTVDDTSVAAEYQKRYDALKACLMMASDYNGGVANDG